MKYIDAEKIRAEIDRRYNEYSAKKKTDDFIYYSGMADALDLFEQFLDTLEEEPAQNGYDEAYLNEKIAKASKTWEGVDVDKYMDEVRGREPDKSLEEAAEEYMFTHHEANESLEEAVTHQMEDDGNVDDFVRRGIDNIALRYAELGAEWQKQRMLKDAVEGAVCIIRHNPPTVSVQIPVEDWEGINISVGDKVRLLDVKED
jgi:hypothetical protein